MRSRIAIIGAGISGLTAAVAAAAEGYEVTVYEKLDTPGGRARQFSSHGFRFDMGPSWYWMPDIIDEEFRRYGYERSDFFELHQIDPTYTVFWDDDDPLHVPVDTHQLKDWLEHREEGASEQLERFLEEAGRKYEVGMWDLAQKPSLKIRDLIKPKMIKDILSLDLVRSMQCHLDRYF